MDVFGIRLAGFNKDVGHKLLLTLACVAAVIALRYLVVAIFQLITGRHRNERVSFWTRQLSSVAATFLLVVSVVSIWFDDPRRMATGLGLITAGLAIGLQKVWTSLAGYLVILRGKLFSVGDRIDMGGVRGDVIELGFLNTRLMEMGQPPQHQAAGVWVGARQYTGRIVTVTNDKVFTLPVYNYTREFPFIFEEIVVPIDYGADRRLAEQILLECARPAAEELETLSTPAREALERRYFVNLDQLRPRVYYRLTDNWLELTLRFVVGEHGIRDVKDGIARAILDRFEGAGLGVASATYRIVGLPPLRVLPGGPASRSPEGA